jgi:hypothetical protein
MIFLGGLKEFLEFFLQWLDGIGGKYMGSCEIWGFFENFCGIFVVF